MRALLIGWSAILTATTSDQEIEREMNKALGRPADGPSDFARRGPRDSKGRSLRDLDLKTRLFRYPCSYLIDSRAFDSLPAEVKDYVYRRLWEILDGRGTARKTRNSPRKIARRSSRFSARRSRELPDYWKASAPVSR